MTIWWCYLKNNILQTIRKQENILFQSLMRFLIRPICWMICLIPFAVSILVLMTGNPVCLISTKAAQQMWPVRGGCLLLHSALSFLCICRWSVLPHTRFCICFLDYDYMYVWHIVNFAISYLIYRALELLRIQSNTRPIFTWTSFNIYKIDDPQL
jgi:hypothetical protein